jgi:hypothetical protein
MAGKAQEIARRIALQTRLVSICPIHNQLYCDYDEYADEDQNLARAFALAVKLAREHRSSAEEFHHDAEELTAVLSYTMGAAPRCCPDCMPLRQHAAMRALSAPWSASE